MVTKDSIRLDKHLQDNPDIKPKSFVGKQVYFYHPMLGLFREGTVWSYNPSPYYNSFWIQYKDDECSVPFSNIYLIEED